MAIKKWSNFKETKIESDKGIDIDKSSEKEDLADDLSNIQKVIDKVEKLEDSEYTIVSINDVSMDEPSNIDEATIINADLGGKEAKRGDILYITAMVQKKNANWNSMAVLKVRVVDMYKGLSILNTLK
tara:strand:+ start:224 stop:607 length:384 start_codon:yes stop_codon:yes gene_type:complete